MKSSFEHSEKNTIIQLGPMSKEWSAIADYEPIQCGFHENDA